MGGVQFFLGRDHDDEKDDDSDEDNVPDLKQLRHAKEVGKKTKSKERQLAAAKASLKKKERKAQTRPVNLNFSAIHLLHDPQAFAEILFSKHLQKTSSKLNINQKIIVLNLVTRLIASHKLILLALYSWLIRYILYDMWLT
jgi:protein SDA1